MLCSEVKVQSYFFYFFLTFPAEAFVEIVIIYQKALCPLNCVRDEQGTVDTEVNVAQSQS